MSDKPKRADRLEFFEELGPFSPAKGNYTRADRYRDFRAVFYGEGTPEQGKRVLWQLMEETRLFRTPIAPGDANLTYARIGKQEIGRWLLSVLTTIHEPGKGNPKQTENAE